MEFDRRSMLMLKLSSSRRTFSSRGPRNVSMLGLTPVLFFMRVWFYRGVCPGAGSQASSHAPADAGHNHTCSTSSKKQDLAWEHNRSECGCPEGKSLPLSTSLPRSRRRVNTLWMHFPRPGMLPPPASWPTLAGLQSPPRAWSKAAPSDSMRLAVTACSAASSRNTQHRAHPALRRRFPPRNTPWRQPQLPPDQTQRDSVCAWPAGWKRLVSAPPGSADRQRTTHQTDLCGSVPEAARSHYYKSRPRTPEPYDPASKTGTTPADATKRQHRPKRNPARCPRTPFPTHRSTARMVPALPLPE